MNKKSSVAEFFSQAECIIQNRLYFTHCRRQSRPQESNKYHFFTIDNTLKYQPFFVDFGPLHLGHLYRFCELLSSKLQSPALDDKAIYFYCSQNQHKRANAAYLIGAFQVLYLDKNPTEAWEPLSHFSTSPARTFLFAHFVPFRDASMGICPYKLTVLDCVNAVYQAKLHSMIDFSYFDVRMYDFYEKVENGYRMHSTGLRQAKAHGPAHQARPETTRLVELSELFSWKHNALLSKFEDILCGRYSKSYICRTKHST
eukprot:5736_1